MKILRKNCIVKGKVQGVFYRATAKSQAEDLGLTGWVKNLNDGSVEIECQGEETYLNEFLDWAKKGPDWARVDDFTEKEIEIREESDFNILA